MLIFRGTLLFLGHLEGGAGAALEEPIDPARDDRLEDVVDPAASPSMFSSAFNRLGSSRPGNNFFLAEEPLVDSRVDPRVDPRVDDLDADGREELLDGDLDVKPGGSIGRMGWPLDWTLCRDPKCFSCLLSSHSSSRTMPDRPSCYF